MTVYANATFGRLCPVTICVALKVQLDIWVESPYKIDRANGLMYTVRREAACRA